MLAKRTRLSRAISLTSKLDWAWTPSKNYALDTITEFSIIEFSNLFNHEYDNILIANNTRIIYFVRNMS